MSSYILKISGKRLSTFIMLLVRLNINFKIIEETKDYLIMEVLDEDYQNLLKIKTTYKIEIVKRKGLLSIIYFLKKRKIFITIVLLGFIFFNILTNLVFDIKVIDTDDDIRNIILNDLEQFGLKKYHFKINYKTKEKIEEKILEKEKEIIEWIEIENKGVIYEVKLIKRIKNNVENNNEPGSIVAKKNAFITKINAESGEVVTKKNAYVNKGDILISGLIKNKDTIVNKIRANGTVYGEVWYKISFNLPYYYHEDEKTGNNKTVIEFSFLNHDFSIFDFNKYKHSKDRKKILYKHPLFPLSINLTKKEEIKLVNINFKENYDKHIKPLALEKLKTKLGNDIKIKEEKILKKREYTDRIYIELFLKVEESIAEFSTLKDFDIEKENQRIKEISN